MLKGKGACLLRWGVRSSNGEVSMAQMTPQVSELLEKALALSPQERGLLIDRLVETWTTSRLKQEPRRPGTKRSSVAWMTFARGV